MKLHNILKDFTGSQTGHDFHEFKAATTVPLSDSLAAIAVKEGWAKPAIPQETIQHLQSVVAPVVGIDEPIPAGDPTVPLPLHPENRETKPFDLTKLNKKQIVEFAKDNFGLELSEEQKKNELLAAIEAHTNSQAA